MIPGYSLIDPTARLATRRLIISLSGLEKQGKTRFALTAPGPIGYMDFDQRSEGTMEEFTTAGKVVLWRTGPNGVPRPYQIPSDSGASTENEDETQKIAKKEWRAFETDFKALVGVVRTIIVDTGSECWELLRLATFGKLAQVPPVLYGEANSAYRRLIRLVRQQTYTNLILTHKMGDEYENVKDGKGGVKGMTTGRQERKGFKETGYLADMDVALYRLSPRVVEAGDAGFRLLVNESMNAQVRGLELANEMINFATLAQMTVPTSAPEEWQ